MDRGSEFRKWDLHVHSPASFEQSFGPTDEDHIKTTWDNYIIELEKIQDTAVIAITDYFTIEGYKRVREYQNQGRLQNFERIFPNIEFRLDTIIPGRHNPQGKKLNFHVIFSDEISTEIIERDFITQVNFKTHQGDSRSLCRHNIEEEGRILKTHEEEFRNKSDYVVGCTSIAVSFDEIRTILEKRDSLFRGKYLFVLPNEGWESLDWRQGQSHLIRKQLYYKSHAIFSSNPSTIQWALGKDAENASEFIKEFGSLKPCMHGSDAHSIDKICKPDYNRYCWIKADTTFEGLRQILYEPEDRIKIQENVPEPRKNIYTIDSIKISNSKIKDDLELEEFDLPLNSNLIAIIGGKGDGKTAFLDLIANCFEDRSSRICDDENSFIVRIEEQEPDLQVSITFLNNECFSKKILDDNLHNKSKITYLPQKHFEEYSVNQEKLQRKIEEIIFNNIEVTKSECKKNYLEYMARLDSYQKEVESLNIDIIGLEDEINPSIKGELETKLELKKGELSDKEDQIISLQKNNSENLKIDIENLKNQERQLINQKSDFKNLKGKCEFVHKHVSEISTLNSEICSLNTELENHWIEIKVDPIMIDNQIKSLNDSFEYVNSAIELIDSEINEKTTKINELSGIEKDFASLIGDKDRINGEIVSLNFDQNKLGEKKLLMDNHKKNRMSNFLNIINTLEESNKSYKEVIDLFSQEKDLILNNIDFESYILFNKKRFIETGENILNLKRIAHQQIVQLSDDLQEIMNSESDRKEKTEAYINKIEDIKSNKPYKTIGNDLNFYKWVFGNYFYIFTKILFNEVPMEKLSMGQKATVLLKLFLAEGDNPLIIDQPEENLDNKFVYESLVDAFRDAKKKRQIIIATHNANLVVNTDAEQVIVSEYRDGKISYISGSIENAQIKTSITTLLEGGEVAFKRRELRYDI